ncbi:uncharacterized protein LOC144923229 isoform X2 [Branchiostoma floridae x Branchiostoma belcheri]
MGKLPMILLAVFVIAVAGHTPTEQELYATSSEPGRILPDWTMVRLRYDGCRIYAEFEPEDLSGKMCEEKGELTEIDDKTQSALNFKAPSPKSCSDGYSKYNRKCYKFSTDKMAFKAAKDACQRDGGLLATINAQDTNDLVVKKIKVGGDSYWIGLNDVRKEGSFVWSDEVKSPAVYTNWHPDQPDNGGGEDCVEMTRNQDWNDLPCSSKLNFICEKEMTHWTCPPMYGVNAFRGKCFKFSVRRVTFNKAKAICRTDGGRLAVLKDKGTDVFIRKRIRSLPPHRRVLNYWIGLSDVQEEGTFVWSDGTELTASGYTHWSQGKPDNAEVERGEDCVEIRQDMNYTWNDVECGKKRRFVCEKGHEQLYTTPGPHDCAWLDQELQEKDRELQRQTQNIAELTAQLQQKEGEIQDLFTGLQEKEEEIQQKEGEIQDLSTLLQQKEGEIQALTNRPKQPSPDVEVTPLEGSESPEYTTLGCWRDTSDRAIPILEGTDLRLDGSHYHERTRAIEKCYQVALSLGYTVFAVQDGGQCFGSADGHNSYNKYGPSTACAADGRGGQWANQVYKIKESFPAACLMDPSQRENCGWSGITPHECYQKGCCYDSSIRLIPWCYYKVKWRDDWRCGPGYPAENGHPAECDPNGGGPCCSTGNWCGNTPDHCDCQGCVDYRDINGTGINVAQGKRAYQTSIMEIWHGDASRAVDRNTDANYHAGSCTHTVSGQGETDPSWWVDLRQSYMVSRVVIFNRMDCCSERLNPFNIHIGDSDQVSENPKCGGDHRIDVSRPSISVSCHGMKGRYVGVRLPGPARILTLCEVQVFSDPLRWRHDLRCGPGYPAGNGHPAECDPNGGVPCCSTGNWCGNTPDHCDCQGCVDYRDIDGTVSPSGQLPYHVQTSATETTQKDDEQMLHPTDEVQYLTTPLEYPPPKTTITSSEESCLRGNGASYRGTVSVTKTGRTCQRWDSQTPHEHERTPAWYPSSGLEGNYCRNPDGEETVWCYTTDPDERWELCDVPICASATPEVSGSTEERISCIGSTGYCPGSHVTGARCVDGFCECSSPNYQRYTCLPVVGSCAITRGSPVARAEAFLAADPIETFSCVADDNNKYEVHVLAVYEAVGPTRSFLQDPTEAAEMEVTVSAGQLSKPLVLVFSSYEAVNWVLHLPDDIEVYRVILMAYHEDQSDVTVQGGAVDDVQRLSGRTGAVPACAYGKDDGGCKTVDLLEYIRAEFGPVSSLTGTYKAGTWVLEVGAAPE